MKKIKTKQAQQTVCNDLSTVLWAQILSFCSIAGHEQVRPVCKVINTAAQSSLSWPSTLDLSYRIPTRVIVRVFQSAACTTINWNDIFPWTTEGGIPALHKQLQSLASPALRSTKTLSVEWRCIELFLPLALFTGVETFSTCEPTMILMQRMELPPHVKKFKYTTANLSARPWNNIEAGRYLQLTHLVLHGVKSKYIDLETIPAFPNLQHLEIIDADTSSGQCFQPIYIRNRSKQKVFPKLSLLTIIAPRCLWCCFAGDALHVLRQLHAFKGWLVDVTEDINQLHVICLWPLDHLENQRLQFYCDVQTRSWTVRNCLSLLASCPQLRCVYLPNCQVFEINSELNSLAEDERPLLSRLNFIQCSSSEQVEEMYTNHAVHGKDLPFDSSSSSSDSNTSKSLVYVYHFFIPDKTL